MELSSAHLRYLLAIGQLSQGTGAVSSAQVARALQVSRPSVTRMLAILAEKDLVTKERYGKITLTETGAALARQGRQIQSACLEKLFSGLTPAETDRFQQLLEKVLTGAETQLREGANT